MNRLRDNWMALCGLLALVVLVLTDNLEAEAVITYLGGLAITAPVVESVKARLQSADNGDA